MERQAKIKTLDTFGGGLCIKLWYKTKRGIFFFKPACVQQIWKMFAVNSPFFFTFDVNRNAINWKRDADTSRKKRRGGSASFGFFYANTKQSNYLLKNIAGINKNTTVIEKRLWRFEKYLLNFLLDFSSPNKLPPLAKKLVRSTRSKSKYLLE